jgi:hypothetical protein
MRVLYDIQDKMEDELKSICRKEEITSTDLENIYKIVDIVKDITTVEAMHKADNDGYSRGWDVDYSYARGRDSMGRYTSRDNGYSRDSKNDMINHLTDMMRSARTDEERESYRKTIDHLSR